MEPELMSGLGWNRSRVGDCTWPRMDADEDEELERQLEELKLVLKMYIHCMFL